MPTIQVVKSVAGPPSSASWERREYRSPDGQWNVIYHTPREWHMGAEGWHVKLRHKWRTVTWKQRGLSRLAGTRGFRCEADLRPWSHDSKALAFLTWDDDPVHIYDVAARALRNVPSGPGFVRSVQWSSSVDRLLVTSETGAVLIDQAGKRQGTATWRKASDETPHTDWTKDGKSFFVLTRESDRAKTTLTFYAGEDGTVGEGHELDPADLIPYEAERFVHLPRDRFCLIVSSSVGAVGQLLDTWHGVQFDQPSSTLYLAVYRPVSAVYGENAAWGCEVEERWVGVELGP